MRLKQNCNILIYNNNEKKEILSHCKNSKTISSFKEFINFKMITNPKDVSEENNTIKRNESQKDHMSRNKKKCKILTNTNSINIENNNTNYVSPKQHEKEECTTNYINTPLLYNNMILMTMNNKKKSR
jgi:hypothetical protein